MTHITPPSYQNMAHFIRHADDPVLLSLTHEEIKMMCVGIMPERCIDGINRYITIGNDFLLGQFRKEYWPDRNFGPLKKLVIPKTK